MVLVTYMLIEVLTRFGIQPLGRIFDWIKVQVLGFNFFFFFRPTSDILILQMVDMVEVMVMGVLIGMAEVPCIPILLHIFEYFNLSLSRTIEILFDCRFRENRLPSKAKPRR